MKGTALTAFLPNLKGFTSPRGLHSSRVQPHPRGHEDARRDVCPPGALSHGPGLPRVSWNRSPRRRTTKTIPRRTTTSRRKRTIRRRTPTFRRPSYCGGPGSHRSSHRNRTATRGRTTPCSGIPRPRDRRRPPHLRRSRRPAASARPSLTPRSPGERDPRVPREVGMPTGHPRESTLEQLQRFGPGWRP